MKKIQMVNFWVFLGKWVSRYKRVFLVNLVGFSYREYKRVCKERIVKKSGKLAVTPVGLILKSWPFPFWGVAN